MLHEFSVMTFEQRPRFVLEAGLSIRPSHLRSRIVESTLFGVASIFVNRVVIVRVRHPDRVLIGFPRRRPTLLVETLAIDIAPDRLRRLTIWFGVVDFVDETKFQFGGERCLVSKF